MVTGQPRVAFFDSDTWEPFGQLAAALGLHDFATDHYTVVPRHLQSRYSQWLESKVFTTTERIVERSETPGASATIAQGALVGVPREETVDIQAHDDLGYLLLRDSPEQFQALAHTSGDTPPTAVYDKWYMTELATSLGVAVPHSWRDADPDSYPVVVKAPVGFGGQGVRIAHNTAELKDALTELTFDPGNPAFLQEFGAKGFVNVGAVALRGELTAAVAYEPITSPSDPLGPSTGVVIVDRPDAIEATAKLAEATGFTGMFNTDFVIDDSERACFIDFNPRVFGPWSALQELGCDLLGAYLATLGVGQGPQSDRSQPGTQAGSLNTPPSDRSQVTTWRRETLAIIKERQKFLGRRWAIQARARAVAFEARARLRR